MTERNLFTVVLFFAMTFQVECSSYWRDIFQRSQAKALIDSIPEIDRSDFIRYHLSLGLKQQSVDENPIIDVKNATNEFQSFVMIDAVSSHIENTISNEKVNLFKNILAPRNFSTDLLEWTKSYFSIGDTQIIQLVCYSQICIPKGCFDPNDIGSICCPF